jgi:hypothetical protein
MTGRHSTRRAILAGFGGALGFVLGSFLTFALPPAHPATRRDGDIPPTWRSSRPNPSSPASGLPTGRSSILAEV